MKEHSHISFPWTAAIVVLAVAGGLLGFTGPGHRVLHTLGFAAACSTSDCGD